MFKVSNDCQGENIEVVRITENEVIIHYEHRENTRDDSWPYWAFHADGLPSREITFRFSDGSVDASGAYRYDDEVVGPFGPAVSFNGVDWEWLGAESAPDHKAFKYANKDGHERVYFFMYLGYRPQNLELFINKHKNNPLFNTSVLTVSEKGADVPLFEIGKSEAKYHFLLTSRHHSGETVGSYVLEGFLEYLLKGGGFVAEHFMAHVVPFVDYDGVVCGDPGNTRLPHNHNRDYIDEPVYASVRAIKALADKYEISVALDFHCPVKWGGTEDTACAMKHDLKKTEGADVYWAIMREKYGARNERGQIPIIHDLGYPAYNTVDATRAMCSGYMHFVKGVSLAIATETPFYGTPSTFTVTPENLRLLGQRYAQGLDEYCRLFVPLRMWMIGERNTIPRYTGITKPEIDFSCMEV